MRNGSAFLFVALTAGGFALCGPAAYAQDDMRLDFGTYAQAKDWCKLTRADPKGGAPCRQPAHR